MAPLKPLRVVLFVVGAVAAILFTVGLIIDSDWLKCVTKPLPVLAMLGAVALVKRGVSGRLVVVGLALSAVGDVVLDWPFDLFVPGLVSFLLGHLAYIVAFTLEEPVPGLSKAVVPAVFGLAAFAVVYPGLGDMLIPVAFYVIVICTMLWRAWVFESGESSRAGKLALVGAALFVLSDTALAINRFRLPFSAAPYIIIFLYWAGQLGITLSVRPRAPGSTEIKSETL